MTSRNKAAKLASAAALPLSSDSRRKEKAGAGVSGPREALDGSQVF